MRAGLVTVIEEFASDFALLLPPEHRIEADKPLIDGDRTMHEIIISGPMLREWRNDKAVAPSLPERVNILMTAHHSEDARRIRVTGQFVYLEGMRGQSTQWFIGAWSFEDHLKAGPLVTALDMIRRSREREANATG